MAEKEKESGSTVTPPLVGRHGVVCLVTSAGQCSGSETLQMVFSKQHGVHQLCFSFTNDALTVSMGRSHRGTF